MRTLLVLVLVVLLGAAGAFAVLGGFGPNGVSESDLMEGADTVRRETGGRSASTSATRTWEELRVEPVGRFDPREMKRLREHGLRPVMERGVVVRVARGRDDGAASLVDAVSKHVPVRFVGEMDPKSLAEVAIPPHILDHEVPLEEVVEVLRSAGFMVDPSQPVLVLGMPGPP